MFAEGKEKSGVEKVAGGQTGDADENETGFSRSYLHCWSECWMEETAQVEEKWTSHSWNAVEITRF